ncbi:MAG: hypothetical protein O7J95_01910 [Planctomycetota bacterium]|nr:hypothetical protein [Planctomycetota bacterium]
MKLHCSAALIISLLPAALLPGDPQEPPTRETRAHDVSDLIRLTADPRQVARPQGQLVFWSGREKPLIPLFGDEYELYVPPLGSPAPVVERRELRFLRNQDWLLELVIFHLHSAGLADSAEELPEGMHVRDGFLHARGTREFQEAVAGFVSLLGGPVGQRFLVECLIVSPDLLERVAPDWQTRGPHLEEDVMERAFLDPGSRLFSCAAPAGDWVTSGTAINKTFLSDYEINQTGVIPVTNPVVDVAVGGDFLHARAFPVPGGGDVWLDLSIGRFRQEASAVKLGANWSDLDLPVSREALFSLSTVVPVGKVLVAGGLSGNDAGIVLLRVREQKSLEAPREEAKAGELIVQAYDVALLLREKRPRWWLPAGFWEDSEASLDADTLLQHLRSALWGDDDVGGGVRLAVDPQGRFVVLWAPRALHDRLGGILQGEFRRRTPVVTIDVELLSMPRQVYAALRARTEDGFLLEPGWSESIDDAAKVERSFFTLTGVIGESHALRRATIHSLVTGVENVSGGTGFAIIERADPVVTTCGEGNEFRMRVDLLPGGRGARLKLQGVESRLEDIRSVMARFPSLSVAPPTGGSAGTPMSKEAPQLVTKELNLTLPEQTVRYFTVERSVPLGRAAILYSDARVGEVVKVLIGTVRRP